MILEVSGSYWLAQERIGISFVASVESCRLYRNRNVFSLKRARVVHQYQRNFRQKCMLTPLAKRLYQVKWTLLYVNFSPADLESVYFNSSGKIPISKGKICFLSSQACPVLRQEEGILKNLSHIFFVYFCLSMLGVRMQLDSKETHWSAKEVVMWMYLSF